jgi:hypothetical protein
VGEGSPTIGRRDVGDSCSGCTSALVPNRARHRADDFASSTELALGAAVAAPADTAACGGGGAGGSTARRRGDGEELALGGQIVVAELSALRDLMRHSIEIASTKKL